MDAGFDVSGGAVWAVACVFAWVRGNSLVRKGMHGGGREVLACTGRCASFL